MARNQRRPLRCHLSRRSSMSQMNQTRPRAGVWLKTTTPPKTGWTMASTRVCTHTLPPTFPPFLPLSPSLRTDLMLCPVTGRPPGRHFKKGLAEITRACDGDKQRQIERVKDWTRACKKERLSSPSQTLHLFVLAALLSLCHMAIYIYKKTVVFQSFRHSICSKYRPSTQTEFMSAKISSDQHTFHYIHMSFDIQSSAQSRDFEVRWLRHKALSALPHWFLGSSWQWQATCQVTLHLNLASALWISFLIS